MLALSMATLVGPSVGYSNNDVVVIAQSHWTSGIVIKMAETVKGNGQFRVSMEADCAHFQRFTSGQCQILAWSDCPSVFGKSEWLYGFKRPELEPTAVFVGQASVAVIVNQTNPVAGLSVSQMQKALVEDGKSLDWHRIGGSGGKVKCYGESLKAGSRQLLRRSCLQYEKKTGEYLTRCFFALRKDFVECADADDVVKKIMQDRNGIGFILWAGQRIRGVKVVPVRLKEADPLVALKEGACIQEGYPLSEKLVLYIHPTKPVAAMQFAEFAIGPEGSKIAEKFGLVTPYMHAQYCAELREKEMKSGRGIRLSAIGPVGGGKAVPDLAVEYVKAKAVVQMGYAATDSDVAAVGAFARAGADATSKPAEAGGSAASTTPISMPAVRPGSPQATAPAVVAPMTPFVAAGGKELLFLADKPSTRAMELHGQKWNALGSTSLTTSGRDSAGQSNGTGPAEYLLAGRAAAVIVNPANKIESLTLAQVQAIFAGEVDDWGTLGNSKSQIAGSQIRGSQSKGSQIKPYGLRADDPATGIFEKECLDRYKWRRVVVKKDSAEVLAAVSMDPQAIGFVDLAGIPATGQNIRILSIKLGTGERAKLIQPTPENIKSAMYPLSQRLWLYVHPQASDTARDFVKFIATCGGSTSLTAGASEASPYADTVKSVMDTYRKHGLVPLADAALERMVKDAMAEAAAKAKAGREKKK
jgi:phosphate transport system substrate-binding protein